MEDRPGGFWGRPVACDHRLSGFRGEAGRCEIAKSGPGIVPRRAPAAEFRGPAALPPSAPLPKLTADPAAPIAPPAKGEGQPPVGRPNVAKNRGIPFDPIAENGPIFKDWPKPKLAMVITGVEEGYIEPCGCAGLDFMKGGMGRRHTLFKELRQNGPQPTWIENKGEKPAPPRQGGWPVVGLDVGGLVHGFGRQAELKFQTLVESKLKMGYDAIGFGPDDLRMPLGDLISVAYGSGDKPSPFVSANVCLSAGDLRIPNAVRVIEAGGLKIGVTAVLGKEYRKEIHSDEIEITEPEAALQKILPELKKARPNYLVLLAHATTEESEELARTLPGLQRRGDGGRVPRAAERSANDCRWQDVAHHRRPERNVCHRAGVHERRRENDSLSARAAGFAVCGLARHEDADDRLPGRVEGHRVCRPGIAAGAPSR